MQYDFTGTSWLIEELFDLCLPNREEREKYYYHRGKAKDGVTSKKCMCIIIDGMDQNKLLIPALLNQAKSYASAWRLKTHLTGLVYHFILLLKFSILYDI